MSHKDTLKRVAKYIKNIGFICYFLSFWQF